ncbi:HD-GYP domain-containing protein, partial [Aeromonas dhakensis]
HEKWDGSGYPAGLAGEAIPLSGRLMALADVYDALISKRVYKPAFSHEQARTIIVEGRGRHFDPAIVDAFLACEEEFRQIALRHKDHD